MQELLIVPWVTANTTAVIVLSILREFCGKSDAAFEGCGFFDGCAPPKRVIPGSVRDLW